MVDIQQLEPIEFMLTVNTDKYMFIKFKDGGRDFNGCDCRGLVGLILHEEFGIEIPDAKISCSDVSNVNKTIRNNSFGWKKVEKPGWPCILLFCPDYSKIITHMGLYIGCGDFIHINSSLRRPNINSIDDLFWKSVREGFYVPKN